MSRAEASSRLHQLLVAAQQSDEGPDTIFSIGLRVRAVDLSCVWGALPGQAEVLFAPADGSRSLGFGIAAEIISASLDARATRRLAQSIFSRIRRIGVCSALTRPRLMGGSAFSPGSVCSRRWSRFGAMQFRLPRWVYRVDGQDGALILSLSTSALSEGRAALRELKLLQGALERRRTPRSVEHPVVRQLSRARWGGLMSRALKEIRGGHLQKVVVARMATLHRRDSWDTVEVVERLCQAERSTAFAFGAGRQLFAGATPERLVRKRGFRIQTEALAGSTPSDSRAKVLTRSEKDRFEHGVVVRELVRRLSPRCSTLRVSKQPQLRRLRDVTHLRTSVQGHLIRDDHVLELALRLHPTPAVGGLPGKRAVDWIERHEPVARGWYSGFMGWFDQSGDGEFVVAIRSGLIQGRSAWVHTGAGIVRRSEAAAEYRETALKQKTFFRALGVQR